MVATKEGGSFVWGVFQGEAGGSVQGHGWALLLARRQRDHSTCSCGINLKFPAAWHSRSPWHRKEGRLSAPAQTSLRSISAAFICAARTLSAISTEAPPRPRTNAISSLEDQQSLLRLYFVSGALPEHCAALSSSGNSTALSRAMARAARRMFWASLLTDCSSLIEGRFAGVPLVGGKLWMARSQMPTTVSLLAGTSLPDMIKGCGCGTLSGLVSLSARYRAIGWQQQRR